mgnify:CR=1 FL=1
MSSQAGYTPPLGLHVLTPLYDRAIALFTREARWRRSLVDRLVPKPGEMILDIGSGTGSLALLVTGREPRCFYRGLDPDPRAVDIARHKALAASSPATFTLGLLPDLPGKQDRLADKIVCSLVLHQVPVKEKARIIAAMTARLKPGGTLLIADYGVQHSLVMKIAFRFTVQLLDGVRDTQPNAEGVIPALLGRNDLHDIRIVDRLATPSGSIDILAARKGGA